jgi:hypothetical protein
MKKASAAGGSRKRGSGNAGNVPDTPPVVVRCAWCSADFEPNRAQLGQQKRGRMLYCKASCQRMADRAKRSQWWRSPEGKRYSKANNDRIRARKKRAGRKAS